LPGQGAEPEFADDSGVMTTHVRLARGCYLDESEANTFAARCAAAL